MVITGVILVNNTKFRSNGLELGHMVLKGVNWIPSDKIRSYGFGKSQLGTQLKNESYGLERIQLGTQ